jgi:hypothetical protein
MKISLKATRLGIRNSQTRLPFRYGAACMTRCPQAILEATIETGGKTQRGYAGDCFPPGWFDKSPEKSYQQQIDDMLLVIALAEQAFGDALSSPTEFFPAWRTAYQSVHQQAADEKLPPLVASFGVSMVERALLDAMCRAEQVSFASAVRENLFGIEPGEVHASLSGYQLRDWLPKEPELSVFVRHTVGLSDPLTAGEISEEDRQDDGYPHALEEYIARTGLRYFKIKVSNQLDHDVQRLKQIAAIIEAHRGEDYCVTLDGNEQYKQAAQFDELMDTLRGTSELKTFLERTLVIEQPLERSIALDQEHTDGIRELGRWKPVIIDESDGTLDTYPQALELGYRGVSTKSCKGPIKSLLNAGLTWLANDRGASDRFLMTAEDLCTVGIVPVQADLALVATLGIKHVERNGHHYHSGLNYLPESQRQAALAAHGDLYALQHGRISPNIVAGQFQIASLHCPGFGFAIEPDMEAMESPEQWEYASLGF